MRRGVSFIIASFPLVCLPPYKHLQSGTEKIKREPAKKNKNKRKGDDTNRPRGDTELHADACDTRRDEGERYRDQCPHVAVKGI